MTLTPAPPPTPADELAFWKTRAEQLQHALDSRILIEQAKGMLAERYAMTPDEAFDVLRRAAREHGVRAHDLASAVLTSPATPEMILKLLDGRRVKSGRSGHTRSTGSPTRRTL